MYYTGCATTTKPPRQLGGLGPLFSDTLLQAALEKLWIDSGNTMPGDAVLDEWTKCGASKNQLRRYLSNTTKAKVLKKKARTEA